MEHTHTPGPWIIDPPGPHRYTGGYAVMAKTPHGPGYPTPSATGHYCMALPPPHGRADEGIQEANARLIAAAPDLLEALEKIPQRYMDDMDAHTPGAAQLIRFAIAKATGEATC